MDGMGWLGVWRVRVATFGGGGEWGSERGDGWTHDHVACLLWFKDGEVLYRVAVDPFGELTRF